MIPRGPISGYRVHRVTGEKPELTLRGALAQLLLLTQGAQTNQGDAMLLRLLSHRADGLLFPERVGDALLELHQALLDEDHNRRETEALLRAQLNAGPVPPFAGSPGALRNQAAVPSRDGAATRDQANGGECQGGEPRGEGAVQAPASTPAAWSLREALGEDLPDFSQPTPEQTELVAKAVQPRDERGNLPCYACGEFFNTDEPRTFDRETTGAGWRHVVCPGAEAERKRELALSAADCRPFKARHKPDELDAQGQPRGNPCCVLCLEAIKPGQLARRKSKTSSKRMHDSCVQLWLEDTSKAQEVE